MLTLKYQYFNMKIFLKEEFIKLFQVINLLLLLMKQRKEAVTNLFIILRLESHSR